MSTETPTLVPLCGYDIRADGSARPCADLGVAPPDGVSYRWLHLDLSDRALADWSTQHLPPLARRTLLADKTRPRMDQGENGLSVTLRGVNLNEDEEDADMVSLRIWISDRLIVTVRRQRVFAVDALRARIEQGDAPHSPDHMLARLTEGLVARVEQIAFDREDLADDMEDSVYEENRQPLTDLAPLRREIIKLRRHVSPLADTLQQLALSDTGLIADDLRARMRDTASRCRWALEELSEVHDRLDAMADHLDAVAATRLERNGYRLSIVAAIFLPLGFLTGLFGVNVGGMPGIDHDNAFAILCIGMVAVGAVSALIMRWLRWF
ncbi:CorA family divalent cation transporter [Loktanella sp. SALINAS62]|uniref:CorA family divalent cation transporter n=1 Tax=Loktanella sp. SALINAS62 TaxID=2706124 RepID=UPI001B8A9629|nr:CorA family divalent cation transporter [Loktanella sp. SALINAS62]MBS1303714.1 zinc transporter ZntB [Loktanella sp. SALINAS62]